MIVVVNTELCNSCGLCGLKCPKVFTLCNWMATAINGPVPADCEQLCREAIHVCPTDAISVIVKVTIDRAKCRCCGLCTLLQPTIFKGKKGEKASVLVDSSPEGFARHLLEAERNCEAEAIVVIM